MAGYSQSFVDFQQVIAFLAFLAEARAERGPWLVVAPASLLANWEAEAEQNKFADAQARARAKRSSRAELLCLGCKL